MSDDLGLSFQATSGWFPAKQQPSYLFIQVTAEQAIALPNALSTALRRCYVSDDVVNARAAKTSLPPATVIATKLPDLGSTMAGEFGEILTYFYQGTKELPSTALGLKKWRLKQDRKHPAPYADVVHLVLPSWPKATSKDTVLCSEVKTKSTKGPFAPIQSAIKGCDKDRTSRLAGTLVWLRERAISDSAEGASIEQLERFINAAGLPPTVKKFHAVAVVCDSLVNAELANVPATASTDHTLVVISVPNLKITYEAVYAAALNATPPIPGPGKQKGAV